MIYSDDERRPSINDSKNWYPTALPKPPVPSLEHTFERYLQYAKVIAETFNLDYDEVEMAVSRFFPEAKKLQAKIQELASVQINWINQFWLNEMYLRPRYALPLNSNPAYIFPRQFFDDCEDQLEKEIPREVSRGTRMDMDQYDRLLNFYREPHEGMDILLDRRKTASDSNNEHIVVMCDRQAFVVFTRLETRLLNKLEIFAQLKMVWEMAANRNEQIVIALGAATVGNRNFAAKFWELMKEVPQNTTSLNWIQSASFVLCLDRNEHLRGISPANDQINYLESSGMEALHGFGSPNNGLNRWYDATIQLIVSRSGFSGLCIEHSVSEGIVIINMVEGVLKFADERKFLKQLNNKMKFSSTPKPLTWVVSDEAREILKAQTYEFDEIVNDFQLRHLSFEDFGKDLIKSLCVSPDGFVQLCLQLAHFRLHGNLLSTYESATMRKFAEGRVDNIRAASPEALEWVKSMASLNVGANFNTANININGQGIDNHLCALEVLSRQNRSPDAPIPEIFKQRVWTELLRFPLSTSQVTTAPELNDSYLCYGPVVKDGYGCAYNIQANRLIFAVSAYKSDIRTDIGGFLANLAHALRDTRNIFIE